MRCLLKVSIPTEVGNDRIINGSLASTIQSILDDLHPEAAYFAEEHGARTGFIFCNVKEESDIPASPSRGSSPSMRVSNFIPP